MRRLKVRFHNKIPLGLILPAGLVLTILLGLVVLLIVPNPLI